MYENFYKLKACPFALAPDQEYLYLSRVHADVLGTLREGLAVDGIAILVTGEAGSGKTMVLEEALRGLAEQTRVACLENTLVRGRELLQTVMTSFGLGAPPNCDESTLMHMFAAFLRAEQKAGHRALLVIDEAQNLALSGLDGLLAALDAEQASLQLALVGRPELREMVRVPGLPHLTKHIAFTCHLSGLSASDTGEYINHRMRVAALDQQIEFSQDVCDFIHRETGGLPQRINALCDLVLLYSFADGQTAIELAAAENAVADSTWVRSQPAKKPDIVPETPVSSLPDTPVGSVPETPVSSAVPPSPADSEVRVRWVRREPETRQWAVAVAAICIVVLGGVAIVVRRPAPEVAFEADKLRALAMSTPDALVAPDAPGAPEATNPASPTTTPQQPSVASTVLPTTQIALPPVATSVSAAAPTPARKEPEKTAIPPAPARIEPPRTPATVAAEPRSVATAGVDQGRLSLDVAPVRQPTLLAPVPPPPAVSASTSGAPVAPPAPRSESPSPSPLTAPFAPASPATSVNPPTMPPPAPAAVPASVAAALALSPLAIDERSVREVVGQYQAAFNALNAVKVKAVWPSVDATALSRGFNQLQSQTFRFDECRVSFIGEWAAVAACNGSASFVPKVGDKTPRDQSRTWTFSLQKSQRQWTIQRVDAR